MAAQKQVLKVVKKNWRHILAPESFGKEVIGESLVASPSDLVGRVVTVNLASLTDDIRQQHINLKFRVVSVEGEAAITELLSFEVMPAALKRLMRRGVDRVDASFVAETADGKKVRVKPFILTKAYARGTILRLLRKSLAEFISEEAKKVSFDEFVKSLISNKFQMGIKSALKKIYPVKSSEVRYFGLE